MDTAHKYSNKSHETMIRNFGVLSVFIAAISLSHSVFQFSIYYSYDPRTIPCCAPFCMYIYSPSLADPFVYLPFIAMILGVSLLVKKLPDKKGAVFGIVLALCSLCLQLFVSNKFPIKF